MSNATAIQLTTSDNHQLSAFLAEPDAEPRAGLVILQEIFGVTEHMQNISRRYAEQGYRTIVPALFDRVAPDSVIPYAEADQGRALAGQCQPNEVLKDIQAAADLVSVGNKVSVLGFCWGGTYAYLSACELHISAAVAYYGTRIVEQLNKKPRCPVQFHFGEEDPMITPDHVEQIKAANPTQPIYVYQGAGHAFSNADRPSYHEEASRLAEDRTLSFLQQTV